MLQTFNLNFSYGNNTTDPVLIDINLSIKEGESISIMGANGSGKSTLARCLNGLLLPAEGDVLVDGLNTKDSVSSATIRSRVGMVFQNPENQIVSTTVEREVAFGLENLGIGYDKMHKIVNEMLSRFDLERYRTHPPHHLSGGEMQRLALASIMAMSPKYIIFDEPTSLLDVASRKMLLSIIADLHKESKSRQKHGSVSTIFITQYPEETLFFDRLIILSGGRILFDDRPSHIFQQVEDMHKLGLEVPVEFEVSYYLKKISSDLISLNTSDFLPIP